MTLLQPTSQPPSDADLIALVRAGDVTAYGDLHDRHRDAAVAVARHLARDRHEADDLVSEGFARVLAALRKGAGPSEAFRPYLLTTVRRLAYDGTAHRQRERPDDEVAIDLTTPDDAVEALTDGFDAAMVATAYASLPERWQAILWHTEVEGQRPAEVAPLLGIQPNAVAALAYRAREGLRQAYLSAHARSAPDRACRDAVPQLGALVRGGLSRRAEAKVRQHMDECDRCRAAYGEVVHLDSTIRGALAVVVVGGAAATPWLAGLPAPAAVASASAVASGSSATSGAVGAMAGAGRRVFRVVRQPQGAAVVAAAAVVAVAGLVVGLPLGSDPEPRTALAVPSASRPSDPATAPAGPGAEPEVAVEGATVTAPPTDAGPPAAQVGSVPAPPAEPAPVPSPEPTPPAGPSSSEPTPPTTSPPTNPPATRPPTTSPPTPPTTQPPGPPTTPPPPEPPPEPPVPVELSTDVYAVGALVAERDGMVGVTVVNDGEGTVAMVEVEVAPAATADPGTTLDAPPGCSAAGPTVTCRAADLAPGASAVWFLRVDPAPAPPTLPLVVTTRAPLAPDDDPELQEPSLPVAPPGPGVTARFATVMAGSVANLGNTVLSCPVVAPGCADAAAGVGDQLDNNNWAMTPVDVDDDPTTVTSSRATVALPAGAEVVFAGLYWAGSLEPGADGAPAPVTTDPGTVVVTPPGGAPVAVAAAPDDVAVDQSGSSYQSFADVTSLVRSAGEVTVADIHTATGSGAFAGWGLVVVHTDPAAPRRTLLVFDGQARSGPGVAPELTIGGYLARADGGARVGLVGFDGDAGITGDRVVVDGVALGDAANPVDNVGNGTVSRDGAAVGGRTPVDPNTFGVDVDDIDARGVLVPGSTRATVRVETEVDVIHVSALTVVVDNPSSA